jgi:acyl-coenzyme A thioesterase 13
LTQAHPEADSSDHPQNRLKILHGGTIASLVDLGGSLAVASKGHYATGVSTDLTGKSECCRAEMAVV